MTDLLPAEPGPAGRGRPRQSPNASAPAEQQPETRAESEVPQGRSDDARPPAAATRDPSPAALAAALHVAKKHAARDATARPPPPGNEKCGWRVAEWGPLIGLGRSSVWSLIQSGAIESVTVGGRRVITTPPRAFLERMKNLPPPPKRGRGRPRKPAA